MLIFPATSLLPSLYTCERIRAQVESHAWTDLLKGRVTVSIGVTQYVLGESVLEIFSRADTAMYMAKEGGRNQVVVEEPIAKGDSQMSDLSIPSSHAFLLGLARMGAQAPGRPAHRRHRPTMSPLPKPIAAGL